MTKEYDIPDSDTSLTSSGPQADAKARNAVWPTDIFGIDAKYDQEVAHLLPAGKEYSKDWSDVACAVLGICTQEWLGQSCNQPREGDQSDHQQIDTGGTSKNCEELSNAIKMKAVRGCIKPRAGSCKGNHQQTEPGDTSVGSNSKRKASRDPGTGVVHFVTNKIRLQGQSSALDGDSPYCMIVPVMTLKDAKEWRGKGYEAICFVGRPSSCHGAEAEGGQLYDVIGLTRSALCDIKHEHTRDALRWELEMACEFLKEAVLALVEMIAIREGNEFNVGKPEDEATEQPPDKSMSDVGNNNYRIPCLRSGSEQDDKPVCLVTFGNHEDTDKDPKHPAPDPLLLVLRAANTFGIMARMKMLAAGSSDDDEISEGDRIAEEAWLAAREELLRPKSWSDLARGLGQPNGYFASLADAAA